MAQAAQLSLFCCWHAQFVWSLFSVFLLATCGCGQRLGLLLKGIEGVMTSCENAAVPKMVLPEAGR